MTHPQVFRSPLWIFTAVAPLILEILDVNPRPLVCSFAPVLHSF